MWKLLLAGCWLLVTTNLQADELQLDDLVGEWHYVAWADSSAPEAKRPVGATIVIDGSGAVVTRMRDRDVPAQLQFSDGHITYTDATGEQLWQVVSFAPDESLVIEHRGALMFLERR